MSLREESETVYLPKHITDMQLKMPDTKVDPLCSNYNIRAFLNFLDNKYKDSDTIECYAEKCTMLLYSKSDGSIFPYYRPYVELWNPSSHYEGGNAITIMFDDYCIKGSTIIFNVRTSILRNPPKEHTERDFVLKFHESELPIEHTKQSCKHIHTNENAEFFDYLENFNTSDGTNVLRSK